MPTTTCPSCTNEIRYKDEHAGRSGRCKSCGERLTLPEPPESPDEARGRLLALVLNAQADIARSNNPGDEEAASDEAAERMVHLLSGSICQGCNTPAPTRNVCFLQAVGAILLVFFSEVRGRMCRSCINKHFGERTLWTALGGWWWTLGFLATPYVILVNLGQYVFSLALPYPPGDGDRHRGAVALAFAVVTTPLWLSLFFAALGWLAGRPR